MDVLYYDENSTHIYGRHLKTIEKSYIFPLEKRPFNGRLFPGPKDPRAYLKYMHPGAGASIDFQCIVGPWDYLNEKAKPPEETVQVDCSSLVNYFPFVSMTREAGGRTCKEDLVIKGEVVSSYIRSAKYIPQC